MCYCGEKQFFQKHIYPVFINYTALTGDYGDFFLSFFMFSFFYTRLTLCRCYNRLNVKMLDTERSNQGREMENIKIVYIIYLSLLRINAMLVRSRSI